MISRRSEKSIVLTVKINEGLYSLNDDAPLSINNVSYVCPSFHRAQVAGHLPKSIDAAFE